MPSETKPLMYSQGDESTPLPYEALRGMTGELDEISPPIASLQTRDKSSQRVAFRLPYFGRRIQRHGGLSSRGHGRIVGV